MNYSVSDFIIRLKNASLARRRKFIMPYDGLIKEIGNILVKGGFLESVKKEKVNDKEVLGATIKFDRRKPVMSDVEIVSKPSLRIYTNAKNIKDVQKKGMNTIVISTSKGIMLGRDAHKKGIGGEVLFKIW